MKKRIVLVGMSALLSSTLYGFEYKIVSGDQMLGAVKEITDLTIFDKNCINYLYHEDYNSGVIKAHSIKYNFNSDILPLTKLDKGQGFKLNAAYNCTVTLPTLADDQIEFKNKIYTKIVSPTTQRVWLDKNLGAVNTCDKELSQYNSLEEYNANESDCFGDYYQWGRKADDHQLKSSSTTLDAQESINNTNRLFVINESTANSANYGDWVDNETLSTRQESWQSVTGNSICPVGFRVPTLNEVTAELGDPASAVTTLKLPYSGVRYSSYDAKIYGDGYYGAFWTTTIADSPMNHYPMRVNFSSTGHNIASDDASRGIPVRCIQK